VTALDLEGITSLFYTLDTFSGLAALVNLTLAVNNGGVMRPFPASVALFHGPGAQLQWLEVSGELDSTLPLDAEGAAWQAW
jgi:hypothetical protein